MWALTVGGVWQICASMYEMNVSATHSIIGAIVGFSMAFKGQGAVLWAQEQTVCSGPLLGFNTAGNRQAIVAGMRPTSEVPGGGARMPSYQPALKGASPVFLRGKLGLPITMLIDPLTCKTRGSTNTIVNSSVLSAWTGLNITGLDGKPQSMYSATTAYDQLNWLVNIPGNTPGNKNVTKGFEAWMEFQLLTTNYPPAAPYDCANGLTAYPGSKAPAADWQFWYQSSSTSPGICTTASNAELPFPPTKGVLAIVLAWFFSPVLTACASSILFLLSRHLVLRHDNAYKRSFYVLPPMVFLTFWINIYFVLTKGAAKTLTKEAAGWTVKKAAWIAAASAGGASFFSAVVVVPLLYRRIETVHQERDAKAITDEEEKNRKLEEDPEQQAADELAAAVPLTPAEERMAKIKSFFGKAQTAAMHGMNVDVHAIIEEDELVAAIHQNAEVFDEKAETVFSYLQVFSAICVIFAHGAGEVGYMSGPLGAILSIVRSGTLNSSNSPPTWTVLIGAFGLVIGLGTYGYTVTRAVGTRLAKLTPSRGFAAELATSMIIMIASQYGLPTSSSQCVTGGIIGIALCEGRKGLNIKFLLQTFTAWIWTIILVAMITAFFFSQGAYAPSAQMARQIGYYEEALSARSNFLLTKYQGMIAASGYLTNNTNDLFALHLTNTIANTGSGQYYSYNKPPAGFYPGNKSPVIQTVAPWQMVGYLDTALALIERSVMPNPNGINMCNGITSGTTNYQLNGALFPWTAVSAKNFTDKSTSFPVSTDARGPCTNLPAAGFKAPTSIDLTPVNFVGPSPFSPFTNVWEDVNGASIYTFNATVERLFSSSGIVPATAAPVTGTVTLDQVKLPATIGKPCQQAPCNQQACYGAPCGTVNGVVTASPMDSNNLYPYIG